MSKLFILDHFNQAFILLQVKIVDTTVAEIAKCIQETELDIPLTKVMSVGSYEVDYRKYWKINSLKKF